MDKNKKILIELIVVVALVGFGLWSLSKNPAPVANNITPKLIGDSPQSTEDTSVGSVNTGSSAASISYANALVKYKDARIQLDQNCQAHPNNVTYKNNTDIMIDNRASVARTVKVGSSFGIKAWGFKIVKLSSATLPATWYVDCGGSQNVATILIQK